MAQHHTFAYGDSNLAISPEELDSFGGTLAKMGAALGDSMAKNDKVVNGFIVAAIDVLHRSGNKVPLLALLSRIDDADISYVKTLMGAIGGVGNDGKPALTYKATKGELSWPTWWRSASLVQGEISRVMAAHGKRSFRLVAKDIRKESAKPAAFDGVKRAKTLVHAMAEAGLSLDDIRAAINAALIAEFKGPGAKTLETAPDAVEAGPQAVNQAA